MREWLINEHGKVFGPVSWSELEQRTRQGRLTKNHLVKKISETKWQSAHEIKGLFHHAVPNITKHKAQTSPPSPSQLPSTTKITQKASTLPPPRITTTSRSFVLQASSNQLITAIAITAGCLFGLTAIILLTTNRHSNLAGNAYALVDKLNEPSTPIPLGNEISTNQIVPSQDNDAKVEKSIERIIADTENSVALIQTPLGLGTGFMIGDGVLVTNKHVINSTLIRDILIYFAPNSDTQRGPFDCNLIYKDPSRDLAFLALNTDKKPIPISPSREFRRGQEVIAIGNPGIGESTFLPNAISRGLMSSRIGIGAEELFQVDISINPGNSGGPLLNREGMVVGVVTARAAEEEGIGFCIPSYQLLSSFRESQQLGRSQTRSNEIRHNRLACVQILGSSSAILLSKIEKYVSLDNAPPSTDLDGNQRETTYLNIDEFCGITSELIDDVVTEYRRLDSLGEINPSLKLILTDFMFEFRGFLSDINATKRSASSLASLAAKFAETRSLFLAKLKHKSENSNENP